MSGAAHHRATAPLLVVGAALFAYALLGNYLALPGYLRFLARGGSAGHDVDAAVVVGAIKTIVWMYSFQLGAVCFALARALRRGLSVTALLAVAFGWLAAWSIPALPAPGAWFYVVLGSIDLVAIAAALALPDTPRSPRRELLHLLALLFFAFATWEVCGLGSTGRMLHPDEAALPIPHRLLVTQSSKLMIELSAAWLLLVVSGRAARAGAA